MTSTVSAAVKINTSPRLLSSEATKSLKTRLDDLASDACPVNPAISDDILLLTLDGDAWFSLSSYHARRAVASALKERGYPTTSTSNCIVSEKFPLYIRSDLFNDSIQTLIMAVGQMSDRESDALVTVLMDFNRIQFTWPSNDDQELDFASYFVLMTKEKGKLVFDKRLGCSVKLISMAIRQSQNGPVVIYQTDVNLAFGVEAISVVAHVTENVFVTSTMSKQRYLPLTDEMLAELIVAGKRTAQLLMSQETTHGQMKGVGFVPGMMGKKVSVAVNGRVIQDPSGCHEMMPDEFSGLLRLYDLYVDDEGDLTPSILREDHGYAELMPYGVLYDLTESRWFIARVDDLKPVDFSENAFDQLVLDANKKHLIHAVVKNRDIVNSGTIQGKGKNAIFLLSGMPGCGKTMTAEAVAESIQKPLFKVNLGTLSSNIEKLEKRLGEVLQLAARWDAVLLIDEADAYMEVRDSTNLARNALVAVFLRLLEYYAGVLFLTTNRRDQIDPAFWSRITLAFHYPSLDDAGLKVIWKNMLRNVGVTVSDSEIAALLVYGANGREIGNAINAGQSLAFESGEPLNASHIAQILAVNKQFMKNLGSDSRQQALKGWGGLVNWLQSMSFRG
jgi:hypothetical protein